jgi:hypothetical protein
MPLKTSKEMLRDALLPKLPGVQAERLAIRTQGCWNCKNWRPEGAANLWWDHARGDLLANATRIALDSPMGEKHPRVLAVRHMVPLIDEQAHLGKIGCCSVGKQPNGDPVGDFVFSTYLCGQWSGAEGASVAREGEKADALPEELMERMNSGEKID